MQQRQTNQTEESDHWFPMSAMQIAFRVKGVRMVLAPLMSDCLKVSNETCMKGS